MTYFERFSKSPIAVSDIYLSYKNYDTLLYLSQFSIDGYLSILRVYDKNKDSVIYSKRDSTNYYIGGYCISVEKDSIAWVGTDSGLFRYTPNSLTHLDSANSPLQYNKVKKLVVDRNNKKWLLNVSTTRPAPWKLYRYNDTVWDMFDTSNTPIRSLSTNCLAVDSTNKIWFGTTDGLGMYDTAWHFYTYPDIPLDSQITTVSTIEVDRQGVVWAGNFGAVLRFANNTWTRFENHDYIDFAPTAIAQDTNGNTWLACSGNFAIFKEGGISGRIVVLPDTGKPIYDDSLLAFETVFPEGDGSGFLNVFPNPVNKNLKISYEIQKESNIEAILCDINGKKLKEIYKGKQAPGSHNIDITTEGIPQGSYYLILIINGEKKVKKLVKIE